MSFFSDLKNFALNSVRNTPVLGGLIRTGDAARSLFERRGLEEAITRALPQQIRPAVPFVRQAIQNPTVENLIRKVPSALPALVNPVQSIGGKITRDFLVNPSINAIGSLGATFQRGLTGQPTTYRPGPIFNQAFGRENKPITDLQQNIERMYSGQGLGGKTVNFLEDKIGLPKIASAPLLAVGALASDLNPIPSLSDTTKAASKLVDETGRFINVLSDLNKTVNGADVLKAIKQVNKASDSSTIVRRANGTLALIDPKKVTSWLEKTKDGEVIGSLGSVARGLGYDDSAQYVKEGIDFLKNFSIPRTDAALKQRGLAMGISTEEIAKSSSASYTPFKLKEAISNAAKSISDPIKSAYEIPEKIATTEEVARASAILQKLDELPVGTLGRDEAYRELTKRITSGQGTISAQFLRSMRELRAQQGGLKNDYELMIRSFNKDNPAKQLEANPAYLKELDQAKELLKNPELDKFERSRIISSVSSRLYAYHPELQSLSDSISNYWVSSIMTSPATGMANLVGAATNLFPDLVARGMSRVMAPGSFAGAKANLGTGVDTFKTMAGDWWRNTNSFAGDSTDMLNVGRQGYVAPIDANPLQKLAEKASGKVSQTAKFFSGFERPFRSIVETRRIEELTNLAKKKGMDPTQIEVINQIERIAESETDFLFLTNDGLMKKMFVGLRKVLSTPIKTDNKAVDNLVNSTTRFFARSLVPIAEVPANMVARGVVDFTPLGLSRTITPLIKLAKEGDKLNPLDKAELIRKITTSANKSITSSGALASLAGFGVYTGAMGFGRPKDEKTRDLLAAQNIPANYVNVSGLKRAWSALWQGKPTKDIGKLRDGDEVFSFNYLQPIAIPLAAIGEVLEVRKEEGDQPFWDSVASAADASFQSILENPLFSTPKLVGDIGQYGISNAAKKYVSNTAGGFIPGASSFLAQLADQAPGGGLNVREANSSSFPEQLSNSLKARVPFWRETLPQARDITGEPLTQPTSAAIMRDFTRRPVSLPPPASVGLTFADLLGDTQAIPSRIQNKGETLGFSYELSSKELESARQVYGIMIKQTLPALIKNPSFLSESPNKQASVISKVYKDIEKTITALFIAKHTGLLKEFPAIGPDKWYKVFEDANNSIDNPLGQNAITKAKTDAERVQVVRDFLISKGQ